MNKLPIWLFLGSAAVFSARAQPTPFQCSATAAVPTLVRSEGVAELMGDIILQCTGGTPTAVGAQIPTANITVFLSSTTVTSRLFGTSGLSDALLLIDEPAPSAQLVCTTSPTCYVTGIGGESGPFDGTAGRPNIWRGTVSGNSVMFSGVPIEPPGATGSRIFRITNIRANATAVPPGASGSPGQVVAFISAGSSFPINNAAQTTAFVQAGMSSAVAVASEAVSFNVRFSEAFATSFKKAVAPESQSTAGAIYNTESGFSPTSNPTLGTVTNGTRLFAKFNNVPPGTTLYATVSPSPVGTSSTLLNNVLMTATDLFGAGAYTPVTATSTVTINSMQVGIAPVTLFNGTGMAGWEVREASPLTTETATFGILVSPAENAALVMSGLRLGLGPISNDFAASATAPVPRFFISFPTSSGRVPPRYCRSGQLCR